MLRWAPRKKIVKVEGHALGSTGVNRQRVCIRIKNQMLMVLSVRCECNKTKSVDLLLIRWRLRLLLAGLLLCCLTARKPLRRNRSPNRWLLDELKKLRRCCCRLLGSLSMLSRILSPTCLSLKSIRCRVTVGDRRDCLRHVKRQLLLERCYASFIRHDAR
jgi:hypothetical protein